MVFAHLFVKVHQRGESKEIFSVFSAPPVTTSLTTQR